MEKQVSYYAIIPANVRYNENLPPNAKLLYGEITALCNQKGYCWSSNKYFADLYNVSKQTISVWISKLRKEGFIFTEFTYKRGSKEIDNRYIKLSGDPILKNMNTPPLKNTKVNTTNINTTINTTVNRFSPPSENEVYDYFLEKGFDSKSESEKFVNYYGSKGWLVGKAKMKNWKLAGNNWIKRSKEYSASKKEEQSGNGNSAVDNLIKAMKVNQ
tara:strand:+ start:1899 stop:2543 length:645 start_codon:yes stop_codon:yes gene_type:complete